MQLAPTTHDLVASARTVVELAAEGEVDAEHFHWVTWNVSRVLQIVERELALGPTSRLDEWRRLVGFNTGALPARPIAAELDMSIEFETRRLWEEVQTGKFDAPGSRRTQLLFHLKATAREKLEINSPEFLARIENGVAGTASGDAGIV